VFRIGEFSRIAQLSIRVLRHYDEIGLLVPAHVDTANGYRYYSANQLADVNRIVALKELGLSLEQVHRFIREQITAAELTGILRLETARAEQARADAERRLRSLAHRLGEIADTGSLSDIDIVEKSVPDTAFLSYRTTVTNVAAANALTAEVLAAGARLQHQPPLIVVAHDTFFDTENLDLEYGFPVSEPAELAWTPGAA
jgi:DNA-binding transcriptional MerR regulator